MSPFRTKVTAALVLCGAATVFQTGLVPQGCAQIALQTAVGLFDECAVLNCAGGSFFNFCEPVRLLIDCPVTEATTP